jgi:hypothetical protein
MQKYCCFAKVLYIFYLLLLYSECNEWYITIEVAKQRYKPWRRASYKTGEDKNFLGQMHLWKET